MSAGQVDVEDVPVLEEPVELIEDFALFVENEGLVEPELLEATPPPLPSGPSLPCPPLPPALPTFSAVTAALLDSRTVTYRMEAWMPEQVAVMKLKGFVREVGGEIISSVPGLVVVHLVEPTDPVSQPAGLLSWFGLTRSEPPPPVLAVLELHLERKENDTHNRLFVTVRLRPGEDADMDGVTWRGFSDRMFVTLRGFFMGTN
jgi:serine/threonine-protein kinase